MPLEYHTNSAKASSYVRRRMTCGLQVYLHIFRFVFGLPTMDASATPPCAGRMPFKRLPVSVKTAFGDQP